MRRLHGISAILKVGFAPLPQCLDQVGTSGMGWYPSDLHQPRRILHDIHLIVFSFVLLISCLSLEQIEVDAVELGEVGAEGDLDTCLISNTTAPESIFLMIPTTGIMS